MLRSDGMAALCAAVVAALCEAACREAVKGV